MKKYLLVFFLFCVGNTFSQIESLEPIQWYVRGNYSKKQTNHLQKSLEGTFNGQFTYKMDTIELPFFDDFASDKFQHYNQQVGDPNVVVEQYFSMLDMADVPLAFGTKLNGQQTYHFKIDTTAHTIDSIPLASTNFKWNDLTIYPVGIYNVETGYPAYNIYDTTNYPNLADTLWLANYTYEQDTANMNVVTINDSSAIWIDNQVFRNYTKPVDPWSLGVATFDGLDSTGWPYAINTTYEGYADALTSKPINLNYPPGDSIYFTFLYQAEGLGDEPESTDSLILEFFNVTDQKWVNIWSTQGTNVSDFQLVHIPITHANYLQNGFKFRFRNYGALSGDFDNWHVDYVRLRRLSTYTDTEIEDFSIVYPIVSLLKDFSAVPWKHFRNSPTGHMNNALKIKVKNASNQVANSSDAAELQISYEGAVEGSFSFPGGLISSPDLDYFDHKVYNPSLDLTGAYEFDATKSNDTLADFDFFFKATEPTLTELSYENDTTYGTQHFANYYAYDDWSAEMAYGITTAQALMAVKFTPYQADSLVGVQMHFVPTAHDQSTKTFLLTVWDDNNGQPGAILYQDEYFFPRSPYYEHGRNKFHNFYFKDMKKIYVDGTFYVGCKQLDDGQLGFGFDLNTDTHLKTFVSPYTGDIWMNSSVEGTVMIRPVISSKMDYQLGIKTYDLPLDENQTIILYPNPTHSTFTVKTEKTFQSMKIYALDGRLVTENTSTNTGDLSTAQKGIYIVQLLDEYGRIVGIEKVVKK